jgi:CubicO group peptidase (beta-lactamase class C family)
MLLSVLMISACATTNVADIDRLMEPYSGDRPGASVLVMRGSEVIFRKSYGLADMEQRVASTPSTHYRLASVTKQFTAAAILTLAERGKLSLDDPIRRYLPSLPEWAEPMTIRHLLTHSSGVVDYEDIMPAGTTKQLTDADVLRLLESEKTTVFPAGTSYRYSNTGYSFLALIVERVSGMSFADFLQQNLFVPLGMRTTVAHQEGISTVPRRAFGYSRDGHSWHRTDQSLTSAVLGDGGIYTSIDELTHWLTALDGGRFAAAAEPRVDTDVPGTRYGFGLRISEHNGRRLISHTGETMGFRNALVRFPDQHLAVVVLTNRNEGKPIEIALAIADRFLSQ